jgi:ABC-2 type transport system permease protein
VIPHAPAAPPLASAEAEVGGAGSPLLAFARHSTAILAVEGRKMFRDPTDLFTRAVQPLLWLLVFGQVFARTRAIPTGDLTYVEFMAPGVLAQSVLFTAIFYGISVIWERDLGVVHKLLVSPSSRGALVFGKAMAAGLRALSQGIIITVLAVIMGVRVRLDPPSLLGVAGVVVLGGALFSTFSLVIACIVKTRDRFMGIGQLLTMPLFFASNAIYPIAMMPSWLRVVARYNPLTYLVGALRALMVGGGAATSGLPLDIVVLLVAFIALVWLAARLFPGIVR